MVVKQSGPQIKRKGLFESRAVLDGSQTLLRKLTRPLWFESRAVLDGSQTVCLPC